MVLPAPFGPMMPNRAPAGTRSDTSATAVTPRNRRDRCSAASAGSAVMMPSARSRCRRAMAASQRRPAARSSPQNPPGLSSTTAISVRPISVCQRDT